MNIKQLERICTEIEKIRTILKEDHTGCSELQDAINTLEDVVGDELKHLIWRRYLRDRD